MSSIIAIEFEWMCPSTHEDFPQYAQLKNDILNTISQAYGSIAYAKSVHNARLTLEKQHLCIARLLGFNSNIIACSYVREDGKRGATAVLPQYRRFGVGAAVISETLRVIPKQFGEVSVENTSHIKMLSKNGFVVATDILEITSRIKTLSDYIISWKIEKNIIEYTRSSRDNKGLIHNFILMYT